MRLGRTCTTSIVVVWVTCCTLAGCGSFTIHDAGRAKLASDGRQAYVDAKVTEAQQIEARNLDYLLSEEIKAVKDNVALQVNQAALGIANSSGPMSMSMESAMQRLSALGFAGPREVRDYINGRSSAADKLDTAENTASVLIRFGVRVPDCQTVVDSPAALPKSSDETRARLLKAYGERCREAAPPSLPARGLIAQAGRDWDVARKDLSDLFTDLADAKALVQDAAAAYQTVAGQGKDRPDVAKALTDKEADLLRALQSAKKLRLGGAFEASIDSIVVLLSAAAADQVDSSEPAQARAAIVLKVLPSIAADAQAFSEARSPLPVSALMLELQRQTVLADSVAQRRQLMQRRVVILKARLDAYINEAQLWLRFTDAACSNAVLAAGSKESPGVKCNGFVSTPSGCSLDGNDIKDCSLMQSWKARFNTDDKVAKRELYKAATSYLQAIAAQAPALEQQYREIDVRHREALLSRATALASLDNLVSVPLDQLDAYYKGGVQPAGLADLIVKALGVVAITVGVTR